MDALRIMCGNSSKNSLVDMCHMSQTGAKSFCKPMEEDTRRGVRVAYKIEGNR